MIPALKPLTIMLVAGEPSGDALGADLMAALNRMPPGTVRIVGVGGPLMRKQGLVSIYGLEDTAVMGLREVVPKIPAILRRVRQARDLALSIRPDVTVLIDSPDFTNRIAKAIRGRDPSLKLVKFVAPQVWASRSYRLKQMKDYFDHVLCLLPFEPERFEAVGLPATFVGHPVIERRRFMTGGAAFRARHGIAPDAPLMLVLPGSRTSEIRFILPAFKAAAALLNAQVPGLVSVLPAVGHLARRIRAATADWQGRLVLVEGPEEKFAAFDAATAALAASGTVTTELVLARCPMVVGYRVGAVTAFIARRMIEVPHITIANLILNRRQIPEFVQDQCTGARLAPEMQKLLTDPAARAAQIAAFEEVATALGEGAEPPSVRAADAILKIASG